MYLKILVPLDGSDLAECVLPHVKALANRHTDARITFLYVVPAMDIPMTDTSFKKKIEGEAKAAADNYIKKLAAKPGFKSISSGKVLVGKPAETIIDYATRNKADLIVMATHGRSGISQWFYGSVANKVLHGSKIPLWLVKAGTCDVEYENKPLKILVPLDGSKVAESVLPHVKELPLQLPGNKLEFILIRVCEIFAPPISYPPPMSMNWDEYLAYERAKCKQICLAYLASIRKRLTKHLPKTRTIVPEGNPAEEIIKYVERHSIDLIVMSTHGKTGINKLAFGSIAEKVLKGAQSPVLLITSKK